MLRPDPEQFLRPIRKSGITAAVYDAVTQGDMERLRGIVFSPTWSVASSWKAEIKVPDYIMTSLVFGAVSDAIANKIGAGNYRGIGKTLDVLRELWTKDNTRNFFKGHWEWYAVGIPLRKTISDDHAPMSVDVSALAEELKNYPVALKDADSAVASALHNRPELRVKWPSVGQRPSIH